jgi:capsule polysaccharide export protein KpsC/LpsZ
LGGVEFSRHPAALLMKRCSVVATICGSAGYEAVRLGKPAVYFGDPWYAGLHGTFEFNDQLDLEELAEKPVCRQALDLSANRLISRFHQGVVFSRDFALYSDYLPEHFASITARSLRAIADRALGTVAVD